MKTANVREQLLRRGIGLLAFLGKLEAALATPTQRVAKSHFQITHQHAQAWQAGVQSHLGCGKAARFGYSAEDTQHA
ncbi:hypothetical protein D3C77_706460 [compost metagenome]